MFERFNNLVISESVIFGCVCEIIYVKSDSFNVVYPEMPDSLDLGPDFEVCENTLITLKGGSQYKTYSWSTGESSESITVMDGGVYSLTVSDSCGNQYTDDVTVTIKSASANLFDDILLNLDILHS